MRTLPLAVASVLCLSAFPAVAGTVTVGPTGQHAAPCAAFAAATDGDTIEIDAAGNYDGDVCEIKKNNLTIRGVNGRAKVDAKGNNAGGKAIWVVQGHDTTIENIELSGCSVPDQNGAAIRPEAANLTLRNCYFHHNENGIMGGPAGSSILIEYSEFAYNGRGDGQTHNLYIGAIDSFTLRYSYTHHSNIGHLVKSRALKNVIVYNRIMDEADGNASYQVDLPQGGLSLVMGNLIQQGPVGENSGILSYGEEPTKNPDHRLFVINNTFVNELGKGTFINVDASMDTAIVRNNIFTGGGTVVKGAGDLAGNFDTGDPMLVNPAGYDYHLQTGSPCVDKGVDVAAITEFALTPDHQYVHPTNTETRTTVGVIDIGAYEFNGGGGQAGSGQGGSGQGGSAQGGSGQGGSGQGGSAQGGSGQGGSGQGGTGTGGKGGASAGSGGALADSGTDGSTAGSAPAANGSGDDGGCGCRTKSNVGSPSLLLVLAGMGILFRRRTTRAPRVRLGGSGTTPP